MQWTHTALLVVAVERAMNEADPIGLLEGGAPAEEYGPEIGTIVPRIARLERPDDVATVLHEEFVRWFGEGTAGPRESVQSPARQIWAALLVPEERLKRSCGSGCRADKVELPQPTCDPVPTGAVLVHQTFHSQPQSAASS